MRLSQFFEKLHYVHITLQKTNSVTSISLKSSEDLKQPSKGVPRKRCSKNMQQIYCNFIEITLLHGCYPVNWLYIL